MRYQIAKCSGCGRNRMILNRKYFLCTDCNYKRIHGFERSQKKPKFSPKKYKPGFGFKKEKDLFVHIWSTRPHKSEVSQTPIHIEPFTHEWYMCFSHILSKGAYPAYRLNPDNILIKTPQEHHLYETTPRSELEKNPKWKPVYELFDKLKALYYQKPEGICGESSDGVPKEENDDLSTGVSQGEADDGWDF